MKKVILTIILYLCILLVYAKPHYFERGKNLLTPDFFQTQFAGNIGFVSAGFGKIHSKNRFSSALIIGYVPKFIGNATIVQITQKNTFRASNFSYKKLENIYPYIGGAISIETGRNSFLKLPSHYPEGYYTTNAISFPVLMGLTYQGKLHNNMRIKQTEYYAEIGTMVSYIYYNIIQKKYFNPNILSLALGIRIILF